ncbi:lipid-binding protein [Mucilaginibacter sp. PPCGB 2223]|uniref:START domain-containing protein n=1 Tax=Mucilaginibacter sp. PPCGB 2223 TaxID=1886027 RepID=UPI0008254048|nr:START domain-containing protein [Mucilaginibacter sp. PPCGB 2223]OCX51426.1 lipid-binding protein [Mucilaginibacter sp. PPCGB 2223]
MFKRILVTVYLALAFATCFAQEAWKPAVDKEGIRIYTRHIPNSKLKAIKVECELKVRASQLVRVIMDIEHSEGWVYHSKNAYVVKQVSPSELYYYSEVSVPWPAQNRDYISHIMVSQDPKTKVITIDAPCIADMVPAKPGIVRISNSAGKWTIAPLNNNTLKVEYQLAVDPAGSIPAWLVNLFATDGPLKTFERLKLHLQKPEYKNVKLAFIED